MEMTTQPKIFNPLDAVNAIPTQSRYSVLSDFTGSGNAMIGVIRIDADQPGAWEVHADGDELLVVLEGRFRMTLRTDMRDTVSLELGSGETLFIPRNTPHSAQLLSAFANVFFITPKTGNREWTE